MYSESPTSPSLIRTVLRGKARVTPVAAIARNVSGCSGGVAGVASDIFSTNKSGRRARQCYHSAARDRTQKCSAVLAAIVDDLAVVGKLAGQVKGDVAA